MQYRDLEIWEQDSYDQDLWHGDNGLIVNTSALKDREDFIEVFLSYPETVYQNQSTQLAAQSKGSIQFHPKG